MPAPKKRVPAGRGPHLLDVDSIEWIGGRLPAPMYILEGTPHRPDLILWLELPTTLIVSTGLASPGAEPNALTEQLKSAMKAPQAGPPRKPARIRVADEATAAAVREAVGKTIAVQVAPTPELHALLAEMARSLPSGDQAASYLEDGRVSAATVAHLFSAANRLQALAPWRVASDDKVLSLDVPELGVAGACLCILGQLDESYGIVVFDSAQSYRTFTDQVGQEQAGDALDLGSSVLSLDLVDAKDVPASMRAEAKRHRWKLDARGVLPTVTRRDRDGIPRPTAEEDVQLATLAGAAVASFFEKHRAMFAEDAPSEIREDLVEAHGGRAWKLRITAPHPEARWDDGEEDLDEDDDLGGDGLDDDDALALPEAEIARRSGAVIDRALDQLERAVSGKAGKAGPLREVAAALGRLVGGRITGAQRQRASSLHRRLFEVGGPGSRDAEDQLLELLMDPREASAIDFWKETLALHKPRDLNGTSRRQLAVAALTLLATHARSEAARASLIDLLGHADEVTRVDAIGGLVMIHTHGGAPPSPETLETLARIATDDRGFAPRFMARNALHLFGRPRIVDAPKGTLTFLVEPQFDRRFQCSLELRSSDTLADLHAAIQQALGWDNDHLYSFFMSGQRDDRDGIVISDGEDDDMAPGDAVLGELGLPEGHRFLYLFDFGDDHRFDVTLTALSETKKAGTRYPRLAGKKGRAPQQYQRQ